jgi:hypothetical protein
MRASVFRGTALAALLLSCVAAHAAPPRTPQQLVAEMVAAARQGDVAGYLALLDARSRKEVTEAEQNQTLLRRDGDEYRRALDERFGKGGAVIGELAPDDLKTALGRLIDAEVIKSSRLGNSVTIDVRGTFRSPDGRSFTREDRLVAHREAGGLKLALGLPPGNVAAALHDAITRVTSDIRAGKYPDRQTAMAALSKAYSESGGPVR